MKLTSIKEEVAMSGMMKPGTHTSFSPLKQIEAGVLNVGYAEEGLVDDPPVIFLHGGLQPR
jgi:hypothetical protein